MNKNTVIWIVVLVVILGAAAIAYAVMNNNVAQTSNSNPLTQVATVTPSTSGTGSTQNTTATAHKAGTQLPPAHTPTSPTATKPTLALVSPASGAIGDEIVLHGTGFNSTSRVVLGSGVVSHSTVNSAGTEITFTVPNGVGAYCKANEACPMYLMLLQPGTYDIAVENGDGSRTSARRFEVLAKTNAI